MRNEKCHAVRNVRMTFGKLLFLSFVVCHLSFGVSACSSISCPLETTVSVQYAVYDEQGEATMEDTLWIFTAILSPLKNISTKERSRFIITVTSGMSFIAARIRNCMPIRCHYLDIA